jgi:deferrochelatase/peroxidase EfeB
MTRAALAIGGSSALSACLDAERAGRKGAGGDGAADEQGAGGGDSDGPAYPTGVNDPSALPDRQHAWDDYLVHGVHGTVTQSQNQLLLGLSYEGSVPPTDAERERVESALSTLERAFRWGSGLDTSGSVNNGLLFMIGYAPRYLDRVGDGVDAPGLQRPEEVLEAVGEDPSLAADFDALLLLDSDYASILLAAEEALFGEKEELNGVPVEDRLTGIFEVAERRTGVIGKGRPAEEIGHEEIPEDAPLSMGFRAGFDNSLPPEETATLSEGPFAGGTTLAVARLETDLDEWYDQSHDDRLKEMYCPAHDHEDVGDVGDALGDHSGITEENVENMAELADEHGKVGHVQKVAAARDEEFETRILRRSEGVAADDVHGSTFNFTSIQTDMRAFVDVRQAMSVDEYDLDVPAEKHGIVSYLETVSRSTFVVPPRADRALPTGR